MGLQDYLAENTGSFDIEVMRWWTANPIIYANAIVSDRGDFIDSIFPIDNPVIVSDTGRKAVYRCFGDGSTDDESLRAQSLKMLRKTAEDIRPLGLRITQNGFGYDYPVCNKTKGVFSIGSDGAGPGSSQFRRGIIDSQGRQMSSDALDLDLMWMSRAYLMSFLTDAKMETIASFCDKFMGLNLGFAKMHTYAEQRILAEKALAGDRKAAHSLAAYNYEDAITTQLVGKRFLPILFNIANICKVSYFDAFNDSPKSTALFYSDRADFSALHQTRRKRFGNFDDHAAMDAALEREFKRLEVPSFTRGPADDMVVAYFPFSAHMKPALLTDTVKKTMLELARTTRHPVERYMYELVLEGWCGETLSDLDHVSRYPEFDSVMRAKYNGLTGANLKQKMHEGLVENINKAFEGVQVVNHYRNLFFLQGLSAEEAENRGFVVFGEAKGISIAPGRMIYRLNNEICSSGIKIPSKKKSIEEHGKNEECSAEITTLRRFVEEYFYDPKQAFMSVVDSARQFASREIGIEYLLMNARKHEEPQYKDPEQQMTRRGRILRAFPEAQIGESIVHLLAEGPDGQEMFVRYDPGEQRLMANAEPLWQAYEDEIFGVKTTIDEYQSGSVRRSKSESPLYAIAKAVLIRDSKSRKDRETLEQMMRGRLSKDETNKFISARI